MLAVDPVPSYQRILKRNLDENGLQHRVTMRRAVVYNERGTFNVSVPIAVAGGQKRRKVLGMSQSLELLSAALHTAACAHRCTYTCVSPPLPFSSPSCSPASPGHVDSSYHELLPAEPFPPTLPSWRWCTTKAAVDRGLAFSAAAVALTEQVSGGAAAAGGHAEWAERPAAASPPHS